MKSKKILKSLLLYLGYLIYFNKKSKVIYYHDLHLDKRFTNMSTSFSRFKEHMDVLFDSGFEVVHTINKSFGQIKITFDDGWAGIYEVKDYFIKKEIPVTIFLVSAFIDKDSYLSTSMINELKKHTLFNFQSHTQTHPDLISLENEMLFDELRNSKTELEQLLKYPVNEVCFPKGLFSDKVLAYSKKAGYKKCYISIPGEFSSQNFIVTRSLVQSATPIEFKWILFGGLNIFKSKFTKIQKK